MQTTKLQIHQAGIGSASPASDIIKAAVQEHAVIDGAGRQIVLRKPGVLAQYRLIEALGPSAKNEVYMMMVLPLLYVVSVDGHDVPPLSTKPNVEALIQRLDEDGVSTVMEAVKAHYGAQDAAAEGDSLKKS